MEKMNLGDFVCCDFCNYGEDTYGGVLIGSNAVCGACSEQNGFYDDDYQYKDDIKEYFSMQNTFKENVLEFRKRTTGTTNAEIVITKF